MKNATSAGTGVALSSSENTRDLPQIAANIPNQSRHPQDSRQHLAADDAVHVASLWKSPRNRREAIQISLRSYEGHPYCDARIFEMGTDGRMHPTKRGLTVGLAKLPAFSKAIGDAVRIAHSRGLLTRASS